MRDLALLVKRVESIDGDVVNFEADGVPLNGHVVGGLVPQFRTSQVLSGVPRVQDGCLYLLRNIGEASVDSRF